MSSLDRKVPLGQWVTKNSGGKTIPTDTVNTTFRKTLEAKLFGEDGKAGIINNSNIGFSPKIKDATMFRTADLPGGMPVVRAYVVMDDGQIADFAITGEDLVNRYNAKSVNTFTDPMTGFGIN